MVFEYIKCKITMKIEQLYDNLGKLIAVRYQWYSCKYRDKLEHRAPLGSTTISQPLPVYTFLRQILFFHF